MPALSWRIGANLDEFKRQMNETSSLAKSAARKVAQHFLDVNKDLASGAATAAFSGAASGALKLAGKIALVVGAAKLMGDAIGAARQQLADMVELQNKSQNVGVSAGFFQSFSAEARKLQVDVGDLEGALQHAFNATKDKPPVDLAAWDTGKDRITDVERALRIYNETLARTKGQTLEGLVLFREADSQEAKVKAVLKAMVQLEQIGQKAAALDLGERMFGAQFVDRIRQGRTSAEGILSTMQQMESSDSGIYSSALVARSKAVDDNLKLSEERLSRALKPSFDDLSATILSIKNLWGDIVGYIAQAVELANKLGILGSEVTRLKTQRDELDDAIKNGNSIRVFGFDTGLRVPSDMISADQNRAKRDEVQGRIDDLERQTNNYPRQPAQTGTGDRPTLKPTGNDTADRFDTGVGAIEKRVAALRAEAAAIDLGTEARDRDKIAAQLEAVAKQANAAAGKGENVVTEEQRKVIDEVAGAYGRASLAMEKAKVASQIKFDQQTAFLSQEDVAIAAQLRGIYPDVATALNSIEAAGMRAANGMKQLGQLGQDVTRGLFVEFGQQIRNGASAWDAFKSAGLNALGKIADKLMQMAADNLWKAAFSGATGGSGGGLLGGLFAGIGKLFGFDEGGYTGTGTKTQPAGIVHKGEVVWSQADVRRAGGVGAVEAMRAGTALSVPTPAAGGAPITVHGGSTTININGNADDSTVNTMRAELAKRDAEFDSRVVAAVRSARQRRQLA